VDGLERFSTRPVGRLSAFQHGGCAALSALQQVVP
jgi:hypothetical protein